MAVYTDNFWFDASGNSIKAFPAGSSLFTKTTHDSLGRPTVQYSAYGADSTYADASSVANNTVLEQGETTYDADSNAIQVTSRQRYHNAAATQLGALQNPGVTPNARVTYVAQYPDPIGRLVNSANYGTNGGTSLSRPATAPTRSDTVLVSSVSYDSAGNTLQTTDPAGMVTRFEYDAVGRTTKVTENYVATSSSSSSARSSSSSSSSSGVGACTASDDSNRVTRFTYTPDGKQATLVAENIRTGNQTTTYTYGTTLVESTVATSTLLRYVAYPDSAGGSDRVAYTYNRQGQTVTVTDQRGCVHSYVYDGLGRLTNDCVTTLGTGVDGAVRRLTAAYEVRGLTSKLTSYDNATVGSGSIVNDVALTYNSFGQIVSDAQSHSGAVVPGTTPQVQYAYANGSSNMIRPTTLTYPNGRAITIGYGTTGGINDSASRVDGLIDGGITLVNCSYLGLGTAVQTTYPQPGIQYTLLGSSGGTSPAGDIYWGLDQFDRIIDSRWFNTGTSADIDRIKYGYDRASNRIWRQNPVATAAGANFDEFYTNDGLQRLKDMKRGTLNGTNTGITTPKFEQCWTLDPTGNWRGFNEAASGTAWTLNQARTANAVNEITGIANTTGSPWANPAYDSAGNMTTMPQPAAPGSSYTATYDAWNRLVKLVDTGTSQTVQQNQYDARMFRAAVLTYTGGVLSETRISYFSTDWRCIEERVGSLTVPDRHFVWGARYIDDLVLRDRGSERLYASQDANWNLTSISDPSAVVNERYNYSPSASVTYLTSAFSWRASSSIGWETLYCGYRFDSVTSLFYSRFRHYTHTLGTWCQRDPASHMYSAHGASTALARTALYENVNGRLLTSTDPMGLDPYSFGSSGTNAVLYAAATQQPPEAPEPPPLLPVPDIPDLPGPIPANIIIYVGHNTEVFKLMASDFGSGNLDRDNAALMAQTSPLKIPCGTYIAGLGCGVPAGDPKNLNKTISINTWIRRHHPNNLIPSLQQGPAENVTPKVVTDRLLNAIKAAETLARKLKNHHPCNAQLNSINITLEFDSDYRTYLETGHFPGRNGEDINLGIPPRADELLKYSRTIHLDK